ncbi:MAG: nitroreductase family protein [Methanospirillum sp.]|nr:nitroreductase family protein [Methanospirillum sp.]
MTLNIDSDSCNRCGICSTVCPMGVITPANKTTPPVLPEKKQSACISCGQCEVFCPPGAITVGNPGRKAEKGWNGKDMPPDLLDIYLKSRRSIRNYLAEPVSRDTILSLLDIARYAASGGNGQPVEWLVMEDREDVKKVAALTIEWMQTLVGTPHPMSGYIPSLVSAWDAGVDVICRGAPHLLFAHVPEDNPMAQVDGIIALTHVDVAAPAFGVGTCWGGFVAMAGRSHQPLMEMLHLPKGRIPLYAMMFGYPRFKPLNIPERKPLSVTWY